MVNALRYTRELEDCGFTKDQANTTIKVLMDIMDSKFSTKQDIQLSGLALRSDMKEMESAIRSDMKEMESSIRSDMKEMESSIRSDMKEMENSIRSDMKDLKNDIGSVRTELRDYKILNAAEHQSMQNQIVMRLSSVMVIMMGAFLAIQKLVLL